MKQVSVKCDCGQTHPVKKELNVYCRFNDKVTFIALVIGVFLSFVICLAIYAYEFMQTQAYWEQGAVCIAEQNFKCLLDIRVDQAINKDLMMTLMGANLSYIGVIFGTLAVTLYKTFKYERCKDAKSK